LIQGTAFWGWHLAAMLTMIFLTIEDWATLTWWNWIIIIPINLFLGEIWPIYWIILRPLFG
jgi:hypothetical protein